MGVWSYRINCERNERQRVMNSSQMLGVRMFCLALGWGFGALIFGTEAEWLFGMKSFIWCGAVGGMIGIMLTSS